MILKVSLLQSFSMLLVQMSLFQWFQPSHPRVANVHVGSPLVSCPTTKNIAQQCARSPLWSWRWRYCRASLARAAEQGHVYVGSTWPASRPGPVLASLIISSCSSSAPRELSSSRATELLCWIGWGRYCSVPCCFSWVEVFSLHTFRCKYKVQV